MVQKHRIKKRLLRHLVKLKRREHHPIIHKIHKEHKISYKTLFYIREYGTGTNVFALILRQSIKIMILASIISAIGGIGMEMLQDKIVMFLPMLILLPALNDMIGDFGTVVSSKFTTMLYLGKIRYHKWWKSEEIHRLFVTIFIVAIISAIYIGAAASIISVIRGNPVTAMMFIKVINVSLLATTILFGIIFSISIVGGLYIYKRKEDPNNFLIPISTSVADLGSMIIFSWMIFTFF